MCRCSALAEHLHITATLDTNKHTGFRSFIDQVIDPTQDYAVYGDSATAHQVGAARGPLYVLVEADDSHALAGNFRTGVEGLDLMRYDRAVYGGLVHFERPWAEGWKTEARVFVSEDTSRAGSDVAMTSSAPPVAASTTSHRTRWWRGASG